VIGYATLDRTRPPWIRQQPGSGEDAGKAQQPARSGDAGQRACLTRWP